MVMSAPARVPCRELMIWLMAQVQEGDEVLDIGCGTKWYWNALKVAGAERVVGLDAWEQFEPNILLDLEKEDVPLPHGSFDLVLMVDVIEHLSRSRGEHLLESIEKLARRKVILLTPLDFCKNAEAVEDPKSDHYGNSHDYHRSLWTRFDFSSGWEEIKTLKFTRPSRKRRRGYFLGVKHVG